jgi:hypothetical protein
VTSARRCRWTVAARLACATLSLSPAVLGAGELGWQAPPSCDREHFLEEVERLTGRERASFELQAEVSVLEAADGTFTLTLATSQARTGERATRVLQGKSCTEVTNAGSVALAMAIRAAESEAASTPPVATPEPAPIRPDVTKDAAPTAPTKAPSTVRGPSFAVLGGIAGNAGVLPKLAAGLALEPSLRVGWLRFGVLGYFASSPRARFPAGASGTFLLLAAAPLACVERQVSEVAPVVCAGYELGRLSGEGAGVTHPRIGSARWQGARLELGLAAPAAGSLKFAARLGGTLSLERPTFVLDGVSVHRPAAVGWHALAGVEIVP